MIYHCDVQLRLPGSERRVSPPPVRHLKIHGNDVPINITRHRMARRYVVRVAEDGSLRLTVPRGASIAGGLAFAERQSDWISREIERQRIRRAPWGTGTCAWFRGEKVPVCVMGASVTIGTETVSLAGSDGNVRAACEARFRELAAEELPSRCLELARQTGVSVSRISIRNQRSRWGACSPRHAITLNWRLIQMPGSVRDYVILHELMHVRHPNHSRRFWSAVNQVCSWWEDAERWLRRYGRELLP